MDNLDKITAFHKIALFKTAKEKREIANSFGINYDIYINQIVKTGKEYEFIVIMKALGKLKYLKSFSEDLQYIVGEDTYNYIVEIHDNYRFMLEINYTDKKNYEMSLDYLQKKKNIADENNIQIHFAISLNDFWGLFSYDDLQSKNGKITIDDICGVNYISQLDKTLDTCSYIFNKPITIKSVYSRKQVSHLGIALEPYGNLVSYEFYYDNKQLFEVNDKKSKYFFHVLALEELQNELTKSHKHIEKNEDFTVVTESTPKPLFIQEYKFLLTPIYHIYKLFKIDTSFLHSLETLVRGKDFPFLSAKKLRSVIVDLVDLGADISVLKDYKSYTLKEYKKEYW